MLEVEGGTPEWCMRILRHETGHAIDNALSPAAPPPAPAALRQVVAAATRSTTRRSRTASSFVLHLEPWYAQSHPDEDFAETFAVWLTPRFALAQALRGLAGAAEARVRRRS